MKKVYNAPSVYINRFSHENIVTASVGTVREGIENGKILIDGKTSSNAPNIITVTW